MLTTRQSMSSEASGKLIAQMVIDALLTYETNRNTRNGNGNGNGSHSDGGSGSRRTVHIARGCTYKEFLNCQPLNFNGTEGVVKYATCTLLNGSLTWWNSHVKTAGIDAAYDMPWKDLMKMMTEELALLCPKMVSDEEEKIERKCVCLLLDKLKKEEVGEQPQRQLCAATTFQETNMKRAYTTGPGEKKECQDFTLRDEIYGIIIVYHITIHKD
ncbi:hypothetical protein Tco_1067933 [Tanacetum coccineum]|uniref:Retrotransposon gag domain-containing protein n=1 Tax=Tanacetum coccineum TaxID=301880 RepID=A0ABQ5HFQ5_9ASTR